MRKLTKLEKLKSGGDKTKCHGQIRLFLSHFVSFRFNVNNKQQQNIRVFIVKDTARL